MYPSTSLTAKKWWCNVSVLYVNYPFRNTEKRENALPRSLCGHTTCFKIDTASKFKKFLKDRSSDISKHIYDFLWLKFGNFYRPILTLPKPSPLSGTVIWFFSQFFNAEFSSFFFFFFFLTCFPAPRMMMVMTMLFLVFYTHAKTVMMWILQLFKIILLILSS